MAVLGVGAGIVGLVLNAGGADAEVSVGGVRAQPEIGPAYLGVRGSF